MTAKIGRLPGRPRSFDMDEALATAIRLFQARGFDAVGVAELVTELGIKPPSFYAAFGSKAGLLERAIDRYAEGEANVFERAREQGGSVAEVIDREANVIGANFDRNIHGLRNDYAYDMTMARSIGVSTAAIEQALKVIYPAPALLAELNRD